MGTPSPPPGGPPDPPQWIDGVIALACLGIVVAMAWPQ